MEPIALYDGRILQVHERANCMLEHCSIHNPSTHPLNHAPLVWEQEIHTMMRVCEHGFRHPDPDDTAFKMAIGDWLLVEAIHSVHLMSENCDGCCQEAGS